MKMKSDDKLIVMLSTYNGERFLDEQLESIFSQKTDAHIKVVVRDDGSKDGTKTILNKWATNHDLEIVEDGLSLGAAKSFWRLLNTVGDADYYAFVDQDDRWDVDKIQTAIDEIGEKEEPPLWFSNFRLMDEQGHPLPDDISNAEPEISMESELVCGFVAGCAMVFNRAALRKIRSYPIHQIPMHDVVMIEYMLAIGKVIYQSRPLFSYRLHSNNTVAKGGKPFLKRIKASFKQWFVVNKNAYQKFCGEMLSLIGDELAPETRNYFEKIAFSKKSLTNRWAIVKDPRSKHNNKRALRSFRMRTLLGLL